LGKDEDSAPGFGHLTPALRNLTDSRGWTPTPIQAASHSDLQQGHDMLLVAPTGSGKTEAVALPLLSNAVEQDWTPLCILYITPLRALNRDVERRLSELGNAAGLRTDVRHGDTPQSARTRQSRNPPHLLVTTPETCQLLLLGSRLREGLANLQAVIIDEVHDLAASERGSQLLVALERIDELCGRRVQRIGLSATVGNPDEMALWLSPTARACVAAAPRPIDLEVVTEPTTAEDRALSLELRVKPRGLAALRRLTAKVRETAPCLIFVNSRNAAETVSQRIATLDEDLRIGVHHGSLAADTRREMEEALQAGDLHGLVCTSSLELGIDVGSIKQVHQLRSPRAVDRMLQRVGRAEHVLGGTSRGMLLCWETDDVSEAAVIARRAMNTELEPVEWRTMPRSVAANQLVLTALAERIVPLNAAAELLQRVRLFDELDDREVMDILQILSDRYLLKLIEKPTESDPLKWPPVLWEQIGVGTPALPEKRPKLEELELASKAEKKRWSGALKAGLPEHLKAGWFSPGGRARTYMIEHLSMIADETRYSVRDAVTRRIIGNLDETFVLSLDNAGGSEDGAPGRFVMAGRTWVVVEADPDRSELLVAPVTEQGSAPEWMGELPPVPAGVAREVGGLRLAIARENEWFLPPADETQFDLVTEAWLAKLPPPLEVADYPLSDTSLGTLTESIASHLEATGSIPHSRLLTIEDRREAVILNCCHGSKINSALAHFLQAMASTTDGKVGMVVIDPYRISFSVPGLTPESMVRWLQETPPEALDSIMRMTIPNGRQLRARLVHVCKTFGVLNRGIDPRKVNLNGIINRYRGTPLLDEALDKLFHERMDVDGAADLLRVIQAGAVTIEHTASGPLGISPRSERDLLLPNWSDEEVRVRLEERLMNERAVLICLACGSRMRTRVAMYGAKHTTCECGGRMLAAAREGLEERLSEWVKSEEGPTRVRMERNAQIVQQRGIEALICLMARGVGEDTATRILRRVPRNHREVLLRTIHDAELTYARTRRYWG
jgi:ATP-dependent Lhr-like helicase